MKNEIVKILNEETNYTEIKKSIDSFYHTFTSITKLNGKLERPEPATMLNYGSILSPQTSAGSILNYVRTTKFLRGIKKGIDDQLNINKGKKVKILYVGSGPFADLILPLIPLYLNSQIEISIIDIHQKSIEALNSLISHFEFENYFKKIEAIDPLTFENSGVNYDLIIIDHLQKALSVEPQVALTHHFSQFLSSEGILIPEEVKVSAALANLSNELSFTRSKWGNFWLNVKRNHAISSRKILNDIFILKKEIRESFNFENLNIELSKTTVQDKTGKINDLILLTEIKIYDDIILSEEDETGITKHYFDRDVPPIEKRMEISFSYQLGSSPRFLMKVTKI